MSRSDQVYLQDILESVKMILAYVTRRFEIIGEASTKISETLKTQHPQIQWPLMKGMRNKLIHEYFGVSPVTIYSTAKLDLPILKEQIEKIL